MNFSTRLYIKLFCKELGRDDSGNRYYQTKSKDSSGKYRRFVVYKGLTEASKVSAMWNAWLHYTIDEAPLNKVHYTWEKAHIPNLTGTDYAYTPPGLNGKRNKATGDYEPWAPLN